MRDGLKIPDWKITAMQTMYEDGESKYSIACQLNVGEATVRRYCAHIEPKPPTKMPNEVRAELLRGWK